MNEIVKKNGIKFGIISGIISIVLTALMYSVNIELFGNTWVGIIMILFYIGLGVYVVSLTKKEMNGNITFKEAFTTYFIYSVIGIIIANIFNFILFNIIDPEAKTKIMEISIEKAVSMMESFDVPKAEIGKAIKEIENNDPYTIGNIIKGSAFSIIFSSIIGLIIAAIFKTKNKEVY